MFDTDVEVLQDHIVTTKDYFFYHFIKRTFDILIGLIGCILILPIALVIKITYMCTGDFKSVLYTQERIGLNGQKFKLYKFRTMVPNADKILKDLLKQKKYRDEWKKYQKLTNDPRITKVGKFLRKSSLDESAQFVNLLIGNMSLIGPRPLVEGELDEHSGNHELYESVKPGISGWWAANGRSVTGYDERLKLEYYYIEHQGIMMDLKCIVKTISAVILKTGAK